MRDFLGVFAGGGSFVALQSTFKTVQRADGLTGTWREAHTGVDALAVAHDGQARAIAEARKDRTAVRGREIDSNLATRGMVR